MKRNEVFNEEEEGVGWGRAGTGGRMKAGS